MDDFETLIGRSAAAHCRAVDPPAGSGEGSCCGIVVAGLEASGRAVVLADCSVEGKSSAGWAHAVAKACSRFHRPGGGGSEPERRYGDGDVEKCRRSLAGNDGQGDAVKILARRTGGGALRAGPCGPCGTICGTRGSDVRLRAGRAVFGAVARPARRAGLGVDGTPAGGPWRTARARHLTRGRVNEKGISGGYRPAL